MIPVIAGTLVEFTDADELLDAVKRLRVAGFTRIETFAPYPVEGLEEVMLRRPSPIPGIMLGAGAIGAAFGFALQWYAARDYPLNVGGRPLFSWPAFVPVTFELGVLTAVLTGISVFLWKSGLPRYHHPVFSASRFARASVDRFFIWVRPDDPRYSAGSVRETLAMTPLPVFTEVPL